jgi:peptidylprolyl isomerase
MTQKAKSGDAVSVHYTGRLTNGDIFDSSEGQAPLNFTLGSGQVIAGFDEGVTGLRVGESRTIEIAPENAYGTRDPKLAGVFARADFNYEQEPQIGDQFAFPLPNGGEVPVVVTAVTEENITLDANHPLAGKTLIFDLQLVAIA